MEKYKWEDVVMTIREIYSPIDDFTLPAFSLGSVVCQVPDSSLLLADFDEDGIRSLTLKDIVRMQTVLT
jgi:hypothetical protein